jgi:hypothetical protein
VPSRRTRWGPEGTHLIWIWAAVWLLTRAYMVARVGFWDEVNPVDYEDVHLFQSWSDEIVANGALPTDSAWQYPPGAAFVLLVPRIGGADYAEFFVAMMLLVDLAGLLLLYAFGRRRGNFTGVWVWLLGLPLLGAFAVLRFDLLPTVVAMAALLIIHRRPHWFGALVGVGTALKIWPVVLLFGEWDRRRLLGAGGVAATVFALVLLTTVAILGSPLTFLSEQGGRGLQIEAVATAPWQLREVVTGTPMPEELRYGAYEIPSNSADAVASALNFAALLVLAGATWWWWQRNRAIRAGCTDLANATVARDFVFAIVLALVVVSKVLSPQYLFWLLGLAAIVLSASESRMHRPAWTCLAALALSGNPLIRNIALAVAAVDASHNLWLYVRRPGERGAGPASSAISGASPHLPTIR